MSILIKHVTLAHNVFFLSSIQMYFLEGLALKFLGKNVDSSFIIREWPTPPPPHRILINLDNSPRAHFIWPPPPTPHLFADSTSDNVWNWVILGGAKISESAKRPSPPLLHNFDWESEKDIAIYLPTLIHFKLVYFQELFHWENCFVSVTPQ